MIESWKELFQWLTFQRPEGDGRVMAAFAWAFIVVGVLIPLGCYIREVGF